MLPRLHFRRERGGNRNLFDHNVPVQDRPALFNKLFFHFKDDWQWSFALMLMLSVGIATLGLSKDSNATLIGAMIIAPLGQPIVALGGAIALGWRLQFFRMLGVLLLGMLGAVLLSFVMGFTLSDAIPGREVLTRTAPDFRDLGLAVLAGIAGSYGYYRSELSTVLTGVAISVALVPPLCTFGLMLEQKHYILAQGSMLLFVTNLVGITFAAILVFFLLGIQNSASRKRFYKGIVVTAFSAALLLVPLSLNFQRYNLALSYKAEVRIAVLTAFSLRDNPSALREMTIVGRGVVLEFHSLRLDANQLNMAINKLESSTGLQVFVTSSARY